MFGYPWYIEGCDGNKADGGTRGDALGIPCIPLMKGELEVVMVGPGAPDDDEDGHGGGEGDGDSREQEEEGGDEQRNLSAKPQFGRSEKEEWAIGLG